MSMLDAIEPVPAKFKLFMAFDFGVKRTGVAFGVRMLSSARSIGTINAEGKTKFELIAPLLQEWQPDALVVGTPFYPDGMPHENTVLARRFARQLHGRFNLPIYEVDERYSTVEAMSLNAKDVDAKSACIILEQFFRSFS